MEKENSGSKRNLLKLGILAALVLTIAGIFYLTPLDPKDFTPEKIREFILGFGVFAPLVYLAIYGLRGVVVIIPVFAMAITSGLVFGIWWGWILNVTGATINATISFLAARYFGRGFIDSLPFFKSGKLKSFDEKAEQHGFKVILVMRLIPLFQYDAVNFGSGLSRIRLRDYIFASFIGMLPGGFITNFLGSSIENWRSPKFILALALFVLLMFVPFFYKKFKKKKSPAMEG